MVQINLSFFVAMFRWFSFWIFITAFNGSAQMIDMSEGKTLAILRFLIKNLLNATNLKRFQVIIPQKPHYRPSKKQKIFIFTSSMIKVW
jgi:hypothetical protein